MALQHSKYVSRKDGRITANCPYCRGVLFRDFKIGEGLNKGSFLMRCPHCQKDVPIAFDDGNVVVGGPGDSQEGESR